MTIKKYVESSKFPIRFDRLFPGSLFRITAEPSRGIRESKDQRVYRKARDHEGFFATTADGKTPAILMPYDQVQPLKAVTLKE